MQCWWTNWEERVLYEEILYSLADVGGVVQPAIKERQYGCITRTHFSNKALLSYVPSKIPCSLTLALPQYTLYNWKLDCGTVSDGRATVHCVSAQQSIVWNSTYLRYGDGHDDSTKNKLLVLPPAADWRLDDVTLMTGHQTPSKSVHKWLTCEFLMIKWFSGNYCENINKSQFTKHVQVHNQAFAIHRMQQRCRLQCIFKKWFSRR
jgi:hypothetical protein